MKREDEVTDGAAGGSKAGGLLSIVIALVLSLGVGGAVGVMVLGPRFASAAAAPADGSGAEDGGDDHGKPKSRGHGGEGESTLFALESIVVNPAGTNGTRFLIVSLAVEPRDPKDVETLKAHEPEIRDRLLQVLAAKTVEQLSAIELRDTLKAQISSAINETVPSAHIQRLFMPQFVLQ